MDITPRLSFFGLPTEIRNDIYTRLVYHYDTKGIISPLGNEDVSIALLEEHRFPIKNNHLWKDKTRSPGPEAITELQRFQQTINATEKHYCSRWCLHPPGGVSRVCHRMRDEVLGVFYGIHTFHFEMSNFHVTNRRGLLTGSWSPANWWRAIGDTNLRRIGTMDIVCHPSAGEKTIADLLFRYRWLGRELKVTLEKVEPTLFEKGQRSKVDIPLEQPTVRHPMDMSRFEIYRQRKWTRDPDFEAAVHPWLEVMQESGLHVRALENVVAALEPWQMEYLRDHISLDDDLVVGAPAEGRGERALKWDPLSRM